MSDSSITMWVAELNNGNSIAANKLWESYYQKLIALARVKLRASKKRMADEEDLVVEAFQSFFRGAEEGRFPKLDDRNDLWQILVMLTARKAANRLKHDNREKRGGGAVRGESLFMAAGEDSNGFGIDQVVGTEPSPEFVDGVIDQCEELLEQLGDDGQLRSIAMKKMEGYTNAEIAMQHNINERTVERKMRIIREIFATEND